MKVKNKKRRVKDEKRKPLQGRFSLFTILSSLIFLFTFGLPYFDSVLRFSVEFVSFFDIESLIPSIHIG